MRSSSFVLALLLPLLVFASGTDGHQPYSGSPGNGGDGDYLVAISNLTWDDYSMTFCGAYMGDQCGRMEADKVVSLTGQPNWVNPEDFDQYAGYVIVDPNAGRALFYYFTTATQDNASTPLLLWINGGGNWEAHSSLGRGGLMGQGPFRVNSDGETLSFNNHSWNKVANIIFLESPVGVGYSYSNKSSDYDHIGDMQAVEDAFVFLLNWLERFPEYKTRDLYIAGDGYAGHSVPLLAYSILLSNKNCRQTPINLKGIAVGNGWMDEDIFLKGVYDYEWMHDLITNDIHDGVTANCNFSLPLVLSPPCIEYVNQAAKMMTDINPYDIYGPPCVSPSSNNINNISVGGFDTCSHVYVESYLNLPEVQEALHANVTGLPYQWTINSTILKKWNNTYSTISPIIKNLMANGTRVWLYSGDTDSVVPITSTKYFIDSLQLFEQYSPYSWFAEGEIAGIAAVYENLVFASVRGGGHFVPSYQPARALTLFSSFIQGVMPPSSPRNI